MGSNLIKLLALFSATAFAQVTLRTNDSQMFLNASPSRNYVRNSGCERNVQNITVTGNAVTVNTTTPLEGAGDCAINAGAVTSTYDWVTDTFQKGIQGQNCEAKFNYSGDASLYSAVVRQGSSDVTTALTLLNISTGSQPVSINFPCGNAGSATTLRIQRVSGDPAAINVDSVYVGLATNLSSVAQPESVLLVRRSSSDQSISTSGAVTVIFNNESSPFFDLYDEYNNTTGIFTAKRSGTYLVSGYLALANTNANEVFAAAVQKNSTTVCVGQASSNISIVYISFTDCSFSLVAGDTLNVIVQSSGDASYLLGNSSSTYLNIKRFPATSELALRNNESGLTPWASVGTCTGSFTTNTTYTCQSRRVGDTLQMRASLAFGGAPNSVSATINIPFSLLIDTTKVVNTGADRNILGTCKILDAGSSSNLAVVEYLSTSAVALNYLTTNGATGDAVRNAGPVTQALPFTIGSGDQIICDFSVPIASWTQTIPAPILVNSVTSNGAGPFRIESVRVDSICTASPCTISNQSGSWVTSITRSATGVYAINIASGIFSAQPTCSSSMIDGSQILAAAFIGNAAGSPSAMLMPLNTYRASTSTSLDAAFNVICMGPR